MKIDRDAARVAARSPIPWIILVLGAAAAVLDVIAGQPTAALLPILLAVILALTLFRMVYGNEVFSRDIEESRRKREVVTQALLEQSIAIRDRLDRM